MSGPSTAKAAIDLISFRPPEEVQRAVLNRPGKSYVHRIEKGIGPINLDNYRIKIDKLPTVTDVDTAPKLLAHIRKNINDFMASGTCSFYPYNASDATLWMSEQPVGAIIHINMYDKMPLIGGVNLEDGSVVCAKHARDHWIFSTVYMPGDFTHPVSGNRQFGYYQENGELFIYTRAADRVTEAPFSESMIETIFEGGHKVWLGFQQKVRAFVRSRGGEAYELSWHSKRYDWNSIKSEHFNPKAGVKWVVPAKVEQRPQYLGGGAYMGEDGIIRQGPGPKL